MKNNKKKTLKKTQRKSSIKKTSKKYYYIVKSKYLDNDFVRKTMKKRKIWEEFNIKKPQQENPDFIHIDQHYSNDKSLWKYKASLQSQVDINSDDSLINKYNLIESLKKLNKPKLDKMLLEQHLIDLYLVFKKRKNLKSLEGLFTNNRVWILKFIYGHAGQNIIIIKNFEELTQYLGKIIKKNIGKWSKLNYKKYQNMSKWTKSYYFVEWVLQEYITEPMLVEKKKFHLRGYYLYNNKSGKNREGFLLDNHRVFTAKLSYKKDDYLNKDIHDTHLSSTSKYINFKPDILELVPKSKRNQLIKDINYLFKNVLEITKNSCYSQNKNCYQLFGSDIMITNDYKIKMIEVNTSVGLPDYKDNIKKINHPYTIFEGVLENIVDKQFPPLIDNFKKSKKSTLKKSQFIKL
tara:strand:- start:161 stop:1375 length:1215 start_codon:yes stop_codon:yes gene_type:complete